jgi:hypothetical protein
MAMDRLPSYTRPRPLAGGKKGYFWELPHWARPVRGADGKLSPTMRHGRPCLLESQALGTDLATAVAKANNLNAALTEWRLGTVEDRGPTKGSIAWLFTWYREQDRYKTKAFKTRRDYKKLMDALVAFETKEGKPPLGRQMASKVDATVADALYKKLRANGERQATYAMQVCRLVWRWAARHHKATGVTENPFMGMGLSSTAVRGNRATSRAEYTLYRETARTLGFQSMATAAALCFECCQRVSDAFGYVDPDQPDRAAIVWEGYRAGEEVTLIQAKTGNPVTLPLFIEAAGDDGAAERVPLYPELEEELARSRPAADATGPIILEERNGKRYAERRMSTIHRRICEEAKLPKDMTFTGFRHGGITEIGDAGQDDVRAVSGHKTLAVTKIYNKANVEKARKIAVARRAHIEALGALNDTKEK